MDNEPVIKPNFESVPVSKPEQTDNKQEQVFEQERVASSSNEKAVEKVSTGNGVSKSISDDVPVDAYHQRRELEIDNILADGLSETFLALKPDQQKIFKDEGEKTAKKINILLDAAKINVGKIISLVRKWLKLIPGLNRYFLDQEAKIKGDRIIKIKNKV